jgi:hypothetical protein
VLEFVPYPNLAEINTAFFKHSLVTDIKKIDCTTSPLREKVEMRVNKKALFLIFGSAHPNLPVV